MISLPPLHRRGLVSGLMILGLFWLAGCVPDDVTSYDFKSLQPPYDPPEEVGNVLIGEQSVNGLDLKLYIEKGAHTGYNRLFFSIAEGGTQVTEAQLSISGICELADQTIQVPVENPASTTANAEGLFEGSAFFLSDTPDTGTWTIGVNLETANGKQAEATFTPVVKESLWMQRFEADGAQYFVSWVSPGRPVTGENPFEVALHRQEANTLTSVPNAVVDLYPYMDMGGGDGHSTPYEPPVHTGDGRYTGTVNFVMSGGWDMTVYINRPGHPIDTVLFEGYTVY